MLLLIGPPGAGKGTQAHALSRRFSYEHISTGALLRGEVEKKSSLGLEVAKLLDAGKLVPDATLFSLLKERLSPLESKKILLDGFPRNLEQARFLDTWDLGLHLTKVIHLKVPEELLVRRIVGRFLCLSCGANFHKEFCKERKEGFCDFCADKLAQRSDDTELKARDRLKVYRESTEPLLDFYRGKGLCQDVDAVGDPGQVTEAILSFVAEDSCL